ncbi:hypothetical protein BCR35DRAFT_305362 [Leucosporidium creatinivorum]|uniref:MYND-type domain-containing protein n=1 Tax=Leucosporidium creatinivorum TaxID=106004 RepID=A0A1Y2F1M4_9BASI|nr:hypothetical protein BCR35DRAFT_305362 [Leucosporidium creatinivorum]
MDATSDLSRCCLTCKTQPAWSLASSLLRCSKCRSAGYCSTVCQKEDWEQHKLLCDTIQRTEDTIPTASRPFPNDWEAYERMLSLPLWNAASTALPPDPRHEQVLVVKFIAEPPRTPFEQPSELLQPIAGAVLSVPYLSQHLNWGGLTPPSAQSFLHGLVTRQQHLRAGKSKYLVVLLIRTGRDDSLRWNAVGAGLGEMGVEGETEPIAEGETDWFAALVSDLDAAKGRISSGKILNRLESFEGGGGVLAAS